MPTAQGSRSPVAPDILPDDRLFASIQSSSYAIHCADPDNHGHAVRLLIERRYAWRGIHPGDCGLIESHPDCITLVASSEAEVFGTVTLRLDGEDGLLADTLYAHELRFLRQPGTRLCEITKLAVDTQHNPKEVLGALFHLIYIHARLIHGMTDAVIEVHPRHARFYKRMLGFTEAGREKACPRVKGAPAILLHLDLKHMDEQIALLGGCASSRARSLYAYFLSQEEQDEILRDLLGSH
ncbi:long-chain N-acyl amino acid synthase [Zoogloea sp.]|uniref:N-acyl amino acid synthase FeeM domain-containing protein n=1 Tax=Zoogloea sp. TaxID=49181 RepID=UPI0026259263|nr:long-chain N-acyl amino acid synthase [Zoogloea sp.]MDD3352576.1 long-chain N-acyl amino acid synthase [Zoogloea sp.]